MFSEPSRFSKPEALEPQPRYPTRVRQGFTLIEMLVVMAVMAIFWALAVPILSGVLSAHRLTTAAGQLSGVIGRGVLFSQSQNTYVWLEVQPEGDDVVLRGFFSRDGTGDGSDAANIASAWDAERLEAVALAGEVGGASAERPAAEAVLPEGGGWLVITPRGEVMLAEGGAGVLPEPPTNPVRWVEVSLKEISGSGANVAVVQVAGLTGQRMTYRP